MSGRGDRRSGGSALPPSAHTLPCRLLSVSVSAVPAPTRLLGVRAPPSRSVGSHLGGPPWGWGPLSGRRPAPPPPVAKELPRGRCKGLALSPPTPESASHPILRMGTPRAGLADRDRVCAQSQPLCTDLGTPEVPAPGPRRPALPRPPRASPRLPAPRLPGRVLKRRLGAGRLGGAGAPCLRLCRVRQSL